MSIFLLEMLQGYSDNNFFITFSFASVIPGMSLAWITRNISQNWT